MKSSFLKALPWALATMLSAAAGAAFAQPDDDPDYDHAILFDRPGLRGQSITIVRSSPNLGYQSFAGRAASGHFDGEWRLCSATDYGGVCQTISGDVPDLRQLGLGSGLVSLRQTAGGVPPMMSDSAPEGDDGYYDRGQGPQGPGGPYVDRRVAPIQAVPEPPPGPAPEAGPDDGGILGTGVVFFPHPQVNGADVPAAVRGSAYRFCHAHHLGGAVYFGVQNGDLRDLVCKRG